MTGFCYFLTSVGGDYFSKCKQITNVGWEWSSGSQTSLASCYFLFRLLFYFWFYLSFWRDTISALPCAWPIVTMAEVGSARVHSLGRVTMGIRSAWRGAETNTQLAGYVLATFLAGSTERYDDFFRMMNVYPSGLLLT